METLLRLRLIDIDESWAYHVLKKNRMCRSREELFDDNHFQLVGWSRQACIFRESKFCKLDPPDSDGDGFR